MFQYLPNQLDKIKNELFVNKRRHFVWVCLSFQLKVFWGSFFYDFVANFFFRPVNTNKPNFVSFWYLFFHLLKLSRNEKPFWIPSQNSEYPWRYSELREPVGTRKNCYPLIWWILIRYITTIVKSNLMQSLKDVFKTWCSFAFDIFVFRVTIFYDWSIFKL